MFHFNFQNQKKVSRKAKQKNVEKLSDENSLLCDICGHQTKFKNYLYCHMKNKHIKKPCKCLTCGKIFERAVNLEAHLVTHRDNGGFECSICGAVLKRYKGLCCHIERYHKIEKEKISCTCDLCGMKYFSSKQLDIHMRMEHKGLFKCLEKSCTSRFCTADSAKFHFLSIHKRDIKVKFSYSDNVQFLTKTPSNIF